MYRILFLLTLLVTLSFSHKLVIPSNLSAADIYNQTEQQAPLLDNLGNHHYPIATHSKLAQRYFDQGLILAYGFNHAEAARSFRASARLDPNCAMCYWGIAYVLGPNINAAMEKDAVSEAWQAMEKAVSLSQKATEKERAYIQALAKRYVQTPVENRKSLDLAYANAMREVQKRYPNDLEAATLFAEALMDTVPWDYWEENGAPKPQGREIMATLESVLARNPNHPGANHLYIHAVEKEHPELGVDAANRLLNLVPGSGHLVHMPSHIYIRVGRYHDAVVSNQRAIAADDSYISQCHAQGLYPLAYMPHNHHFLWFGALMTGQSKIAMQAAQKTAMVDKTLLHQPDLAGSLQHFYTIPLFTLTRFSQWDEILATPAPSEDLNYPTGIWHYARGKAFIAKNQAEKAALELEKLRSLSSDPALKDIKIWGFNSTSDILNLATEVLAGELAAKQGKDESAIAHLQTAVKLEDDLIYTEPADWSQSARQSLGTVLLKLGRPTEAEQVYREDLKIYPDNGWSLYGLSQSLQAQGKMKEAKEAQRQFQNAWKYADVRLENH